MFQREVEEGKRFEFGKNWKRFLLTLNEERIHSAESSLKEMLELDDLKGKSFLDAGSGSGLFSLAARRLGARVHSFDYDPQSVACTSALKDHYFHDDENWTVEEGSLLDANYLKKLGKFDIVYSWGVIHHTGDMWGAFNNILATVDNNGLLFISIYNDQAIRSVLWRRVKKLYCSGIIGKATVVAMFFPYFSLWNLITDLIRLRNPFRRYSDYKKNRGMSVVRDWIDWLGGYPFEVAKPEELFSFFKGNGYSLVKLITTNGSGTNQLVFIKNIIANYNVNH